MNRLEQKLMYKNSEMETEEDTTPKGKYLGTINESGLYVALTSFGGHNPCSGSLSSIRNIGSCSDFEPSQKFGISPGIARLMKEAEDIIERVRKDNDEPAHLNYEYIIPGALTSSGKQKWIRLYNLHIPLNTEEE